MDKQTHILMTAKTMLCSASHSKNLKLVQKLKVWSWPPGTSCLFTFAALIKERSLIDPDSWEQSLTKRFVPATVLSFIGIYDPSSFSRITVCLFVDKLWFCLVYCSKVFFLSFCLICCWHCFDDNKLVSLWSELSLIIGARTDIHCVPKISSTISWTTIVRLKQFLVHLGYRPSTDVFIFPSPIFCTYFTLGNCQDLNISKN